jgi:hypothetical protein
MNTAAIALAAFGCLASTTVTVAAPSCRVESGARAPQVVELYTSEGCSSCPPADQWLSSLKGRADLLPLAFHVNYWDRLGWTDRFASPEATARQAALARLDRSGVYTPQVRVDGRDWRTWPTLPPLAPASVPPALTLVREADTVSAQVAAAPGRQLAGYWAVLEDGHVSAVKAGENSGTTLRHDHVVRLLQPVPAWAGGDGLRAQLAVSRGVPEHPRRVVFVVTDAATQRPLQALALGC